ncbi:TetR/AcrR family transcriptional regulator [Actinomycetospora sp. TBRC 11914]|uniref:TetR/AcrR family transcriptional regulator n=1 Tax=Actinomycetospora sp. TBRC 11914 TaxID=2729387 RepID=UPI00145CB869|nr:TetR/AcrR family transcriptional regulator [Actinomycetospora sp. TBRC 11914]NMO92618.1 TetR/AcrR family transcriptional regulator [Actinomycetospora sp. TBRC 11914]
MPRPSQRDAIVRAYVDHVVAHGPDAVTLEGVATRAGVSKGGLLYHFGSKEALLTGFLDWVRELTEADIATARAAAAAGEEPVARYYLRTSADDPQRDTAMFRSMVALLTLAGAEEAAAVAAREVMASWRDVLVEEAGDTLTGDLVAALGDGIYLRAIAGEPSTELARDWDAVLARLGPRGG